MKIKYTLLLKLSLISTFFLNAQSKIDTKLQTKLNEATSGFKGVIGVYVENQKTGKYAQINPDTLFPTASMVKVPIMVGVFDKLEKGELQYNQELIFRDSVKYDDGIVGSFKDGTKITLSEVMFLMESVSDNTASLWLQGLAEGLKINELMEKYGFKDTKVNSRTKGRELMRKTYGWGVCTPREMAGLLKKIKKGEIISPLASDRMIRTLAYQFWDAEGLSQLPPNIKYASKTGSVDRSRSEVTYVYAPHGEYVYCIVTKNQTDISYDRGNEGYEMIRKLSSIIYNHYEPKAKFTPMAGYEKYGN